ncbi:MAG: cob(I)yrinic acid a,c-diamide adenosyltransferase, partial [Parasphingopyxis sp.]
LNPQALAYINRLSDHLFVMARAINADGEGDILWVPGATR